MRFFIVLAVAVAVGIGVYYLVQTTAQTFPAFQFNPGDSQALKPDGNQFPRPEGIEGGGRPERFEGRGGALFSIVGIFGRFILFAAITFAAVLIHKLMRGKPRRKKAVNAA
jgi:hypothetical protein